MVRRETLVEYRDSGKAYSELLGEWVELKKFLGEREYHRQKEHEQMVVAQIKLPELSGQG